MRVQLAADRLIERVKADPAFGGAWYEHSPCYRLVLGFKDGLPRQWVVDAAEPELRPYLAFGRIKYSQAEREQARLAISEALSSAGVPFVLMISVTPPYFTVQARTAAEVQTAMRVIPLRYRSDVSFSVGPVEPIRERDSVEAKVFALPQLTMNQVAELQLQVIPLNQAVRQMPGFSDIYIEHEPTWHVVVAFTPPPPPREAIAKLAPPAIRDRVLVRTAKRTAAQISSAMDRMTAALNRTGIAYTGGYSPKTQRFTITVGAPAQVEPMRAALPADLRGDSDVLVGLLPVPE